MLKVKGKTVKPAMVEAMIIAPNPKGIHFVKLATELIPIDCQPSFVELTNKWMYVVEEVKPGEYRLPDTKDIITQYPETLKRGIDMPANRTYWAMSKNPLEKLAIGALIAVIAIGAILTFAMVSDKNKHQQQLTPQTISQSISQGVTK